MEHKSYPKFLNVCPNFGVIIFIEIKTHSHLIELKKNPYSILILISFSAAHKLNNFLTLWLNSLFCSLPNA